MSGPYYNTPPGQPHINAPSGFSPAHTSTFQQSADVGRKSKRYYPQLPSQVSPVAQPSVYHQPTHPVSQQQTPQQTTPIYQDSTYTSPVPQKATYDTNYNQTLTGMANMNVYSGVPPSTAREDVSLIGQPPLVQDLHRKPPAIRLPPNMSVTNSAFVQVDSHFKRSTVNAFPQTKALHKKSKLPLSLVIQPYLNAKTEKKTVPTVPDTTVARCSRCKTYINPFVKFSAGALQWTCNMCGMSNEVPQAFDWDIINQQHADRYSRPELNYGCVDFVAPADYIVRPPQPPSYVFIIDISFQSVQAGVVSVVADAIKESLDKIPNEDGRAQVAFITVDNAIGFYKLLGREPEMLIVGELNDIYLPRMASDLIVNLVEARNMIDNLLEKMKSMHNQSQSSSNCLGSALQAARKLLSPTGGKIICFQASLPNIGEGVIKPKQDSNKSALDTPLTTASTSFYRTFAGECTKSQVCADMFVFGNQFADVATLNVIPRFTGGQTHFYPGFHAGNQAESVRLKQEIIALLSEEIGLEAVMRTRCSEGIICKAFYGNFTTRVPDVMALPNVPRGQSYCVELDLEEDIQSSCVFFQTALLYTTCFGERRIRVMNLCLPVTKSMSELYSSADQVIIARALCHQAIDKGANGKLRDARDYLSKQTIEICTAYGKEVLGLQTAPSHLTLCRELSLLPLFVLGLLKSEAFNDSGVIHPDIRAQCAVLLRTLPTDSWLSLVHPNFYCIHNMPQFAGTIDERTGKCIFPPNANLSSENLEPHGCYMVENGQNIFIWIGKQAVPQLCKDLLGAPSIQEVKSGQMAILPRIKSPISERLNTIIQQLRSERQVTYYPSIYIVKEDGDPALRARFLSQLLEDRQPNGPVTAGANQEIVNSGMSYFQWLGFIRAKCQ
ncbi:hypothetical protein G6F57_003034 [Rhizopus arrhizus]|uniref:Uncharacterized protein n=1 Tax=Rhizopus oryzae TaxID=64495 RepID=A0A9P7BVN6_RHIOR|nr:hypothetical protein G6F23_001539 [Rhizopus arrhizus]KAG1427373.1 hypothetical protein G6F58_001049 [Rhizopus delemar]KAG0767489.1 hypothetical protein G6F24_002749 [Rhizopus arrhizus]KAG0794064.1 hypothetical protein G6F21_003145 [Rhizopus arrhizus]KAG0799815.1 hypothetical protein G6F22_002851 [Rhizopus arrhizus]